MTRITTKKLVTWVGLGCLTLTALLLAAFPPVSGYYDASAWSILDGSSGYLHLHDGQVEVVNVGGQSGDSRVLVGAYHHHGGTVTFTFTHPISETRVADLRLMRLKWRADLVPGLPSLNFCARVLNPFILIRLNKVPKKSPNQAFRVEETVVAPTNESPQASSSLVTRQSLTAPQSAVEESERALTGNLHQTASTLMKRKIILSKQQPSDSFLGARLIEVAADGMTTIEVLKTTNRLLAPVGGFFSSPEYGRAGLQVLSASSEHQEVRLERTWCE